jgi:DNA-binding protein H-NS
MTKTSIPVSKYRLLYPLLGGSSQSRRGLNQCRALEAIVNRLFFDYCRTAGGGPKKSLIWSSSDGAKVSTHSCRLFVSQPREPSAPLNVIARGPWIGRGKKWGIGRGKKWVNNMMENDSLSSMSVDELWSLHERVIVALGRKMEAEKATLENRLQTLGGTIRSKPNGDRPRRPYPKVLPKYRNPKDPRETWAGRGKRPRWVRVQLRLGRKLDDFLI